jgi:hypothetical protein
MKHKEKKLQEKLKGSEMPTDFLSRNNIFSGTWKLEQKTR